MVSYLTFSISTFKDSFSSPFSSLRGIEQRVALIAAVILSTVVAYSLWQWIHFKAEKKEPVKEKILQEEEISSTQENLENLKTTSSSELEGEEESFEYLEDNSEDPQDFDEYMERQNFVKQQAQEEGVLLINGKYVSLRTVICRKKLETELEKEGKELGKAIDNGDCFWDAFAQGLSLHLGRKVTIEELRKTVSDEVQRLDRGLDKDNWIKKILEKDEMEDYEDYKDRVLYSFEQAREKGFYPVFGKESRDGVILCRAYKVNLNVYTAGCLDEGDPSKVKDIHEYYIGEQTYPISESYKKVIEIALYPGHFVPVLNKI